MKETFVVKIAGDEVRFSGGAQEGFGRALGETVWPVLPPAWRRLPPAYAQARGIWPDAMPRARLVCRWLTEINQSPREIERVF